MSGPLNTAQYTASQRDLPLLSVSYGKPELFYWFRGWVIETVFTDGYSTDDPSRSLLIGRE